MKVNYKELKNIQSVKNELLSYNKHFLQVINAKNNFDFCDSFKVFEVVPPFTEKALENEIAPNNNEYIYYIAFVEYDYIYSDGKKEHYKKIIVAEDALHKDNKFFNISNYYDNVKITDFSKYDDSENFEELRKYDKSGKLKDNQHYKNLKVKFWVLVQKRPIFTKRYKRHIYTDDSIFLNNRFKETNDNFLCINNSKLFFDKYRKNLILDKSGYYNTHIIELKNKACEIRKNKNLNTFKNYDFRIQLDQLNNAKNEMLEEFKKYCLKAKTETDFRLIEKLSCYVKNKLEDINKCIDRLTNKKYFDSLNQAFESFKKCWNWSFDESIKTLKRHIIIDRLEKRIEADMKQALNKDYYYYYLSYGDKHITSDENGLKYENVIDGVNLCYEFNYNNYKCFSFENKSLFN